MKTKIIIRPSGESVAEYPFAITLTTNDVVTIDGMSHNVILCSLNVDDSTIYILVK